MDWAERPLIQDDARTSSAHLYLLRLRHLRREQRDDIIRRVMEAGVSVNVHYKPLPLLTYYKKLGYRMEHYPVSCDWFKRVITLPVFYDLTPAQQDRVVETLCDAMGQQRSGRGKISISRSGECY
jgi:dTDP-4-amino-4,6-dideoxygalactose transaminase